MDDSVIVERMARDIKAAYLPKVASVTEAPVVSVAAAAVRDRIDELQMVALQLKNRAQELTQLLVGELAPEPVPTSYPKRPETVFGKQMAALDELATVLDTVQREIERTRQALD